MLHRRLLPLLLSALPLAPLAAQETATLPVTGLPAEDAVAQRLIELGDRDSRVMEILAELTEGIGPRLTGSARLTEACEWARDRFRQWGLESARLEAWGTWPVGYDRIHAFGRLVEPVKKPLRFGHNAWMPGTDGPVRGPVRLAPGNVEELEAARGSFQGAWVLTQNIQPRFDSDGDDFASRLGRMLDEEGAAGILQAQRGELIRTGGRPPASLEEAPQRVLLKLHAEDAREIFRLLEEGQEVVAEFDVAVKWTPGPVPVYNVLAEIPGTDKAEEMVLIGGHIDSWDGARGAQDNGTGTATTMEAARLLSAVLAETGQRPRRTIRFMLWSGEEQGLLGSRNYIQQHPEENEHISCVLVHDGGTNALVGLNATAPMVPMFEEVLAPIVEMVQGYPDDHPVQEFGIQEVEYLPFPIGSDHDSYLPQGVPGFFWRQKGNHNYTFIHHTQNDTLENVNPDYQQHSAKVVAVAAWRFANAEPMVPREVLIHPNRSRGPRQARRLGVQLEGTSLAVAEVLPGGLAAQAGLEKGDVLVQVDERKLENPTDLRRALRGGGPKKRIVVRRGGETLAFDFDWEARKAAPANP